MARKSARPGVWVARRRDGSSSGRLQTLVVFASEIKALRYGASRVMEVVYVPFGEDAATYDPDSRVEAVEVVDDEAERERAEL